MSELDLMSILEDLTDDELKRFKWHLKTEKLRDIEPIKSSQLSKADREEVVDLMSQKYEFSGAVEVMKSVLSKINRNDLLTKLSQKLGPADPTPVAAPSAQSNKSSAEDKLMSVRSKFIEKVSDPVLRKLLDKLLEHKVITEDEMEAYSEKASRTDKARVLIDTVRKKGSAASSVLITVLREEDTFLSKELNLM